MELRRVLSRPAIFSIATRAEDIETLNAVLARLHKDGKTVAPNAEGFKAAAANADWANAVSYYVILTDEPAARSWAGLWNMTSAVAVSRFR
jgi:hypothetical protein